MEVYIQGEKSLIPIQEEVTAESIEEALGYTPADEDVLESHKTDASHITDAERESWNNKPDLESIDESDDSTLYVTDKDGNIIAKIDKDGLHTTEVYIDDENGEKSVSEMIAEAVGNVDVDGVVSAGDFEGHVSDKDLHLGDEIKLDHDDRLLLTDKDGSIIAQFDGDGLDVTDLKVSSQPIDEYINDIVENGGVACDHAWKDFPGSISDLHPESDCTTWRRLRYCTSCGKTHAFLIRTDHVWDVDREVDPTCTEEGYREYICQECLARGETVILPATGHDWDTEVVVTPPTCTEQGYTTHYCNNCPETYVDTYVNALGHNMVTVAAKEPTGDSIGWHEYQKCSRCGHIEGYVEIPKLEILDPVITYAGSDDDESDVYHHFIITNNNAFDVTYDYAGGSYNEEYHGTLPANGSHRVTLTSVYTDCYIEVQFTNGSVTSNKVSGTYG